MAERTPALLTVAEAGRALGVSLSTIWRLIRRGSRQAPHSRSMKRAVLWDSSAVLALIDADDADHGRALVAAGAIAAARQPRFLLSSPRVQPLLVRAEVVVASEEGPHEVRRLGAAARLEDGAPIARRRRGIEQPLAAEHREEVLRDHERPHVRVVDRRVPLEMPERLLEVRAVHVAERRVALLQFG